MARKPDGELIADLIRYSADEVAVYYFETPETLILLIHQLDSEEKALQFVVQSKNFEVYKKKQLIQIDSTRNFRVNYKMLEILRQLARYMGSAKAILYCDWLMTNIVQLLEICSRTGGCDALAVTCVEIFTTAALRIINSRRLWNRLKKMKYNVVGLLCKIIAQERGCCVKYNALDFVAHGILGEKGRKYTMDGIEPHVADLFEHMPDDYSNQGTDTLSSNFLHVAYNLIANGRCRVLLKKTKLVAFCKKHQNLEFPQAKLARIILRAMMDDEIYVFCLEFEAKCGPQIDAYARKITSNMHNDKTGFSFCRASKTCAAPGCETMGELKVCSSFRKVSYCSRECQKKCWKAHKKLCRKLAS